VLPSGKVLEADVCIVGVGVVPATTFLKGSRVLMSERGEVIVNEVELFIKRCCRVHYTLVHGGMSGRLCLR